MALVSETTEKYSDLQKEIILLVDIDNIPVNDTLKLQNLVYFFSRIVKKTKEQGFKPHKYGPYSELVEKELQNMIRQEILSMDDDKISTTLKGKEIFDDIIKETSIKVISQVESRFGIDFKDKENKFRYILSEWKSLINDLTRDEVLTFICCDMLDMMSDRAEYERLKPHFEEHITSMIKKDIIGVARGAELLDKPLEYMMDKGFVELSE